MKFLRPAISKRIPYYFNTRCNLSLQFRDADFHFVSGIHCSLYAANLMTSSDHDCRTSVANVLANFQKWVSSQTQGNETVANLVLPEQTLELDSDPETLHTICTLLYDASCTAVQQNESVRVAVRYLPSSIDFEIAFQPNPMYSMALKNLTDSIDQPATLKMTQTAPDGIILLMLARRLVSTILGNTSVIVEGDAKITIHSYIVHSLPSRKEHLEHPTVLIIEDTKPIGLLMELYLRQEGFKTLLAHDGDAGVRIAQEHRPDLITLDVMMPQKDGWQALTELKASPATATIPVVVISVLKDRQIGYEFGATDYLTKPVVRQDFINAIRGLLSVQGAAPSRRIKQLHRIALFTKSQEWEMDMKARFVDARCTLHPFSSHTYLDDILNSDQSPDAFVVDFEEDFKKAFSIACRLRVYQTFDAIPLIAFCHPEAMEALRSRSRQIVDFIAERGSFFPGTLVSNP